MASFDVNATPTNSADPAISYTLAKADELLLESAIWSSDELAFAPVIEAGYQERYRVAGFYSIASGGVCTSIFDARDASGVPYVTETLSGVLAPDLSIPLEHAYGGDVSGFEDYDYYLTNAGTITIAPEEGSLSHGRQGAWVINDAQASTVEKVFYTGGYGVAGQQVLIEGDATATEEYPTNVNVANDQITIGDLGMADTNGTAYGVVANGASVKMTPKAKVPMQSYTLEGAKYTPYSWTHSPALTDTNRSRTTLGVGEEVDCGFIPTPWFALHWATTGGGLSTAFAASTTLTAPSNAAPSVAVTAKLSGGPTVKFPPFTVVEPSSETAVKDGADDTFPTNVYGAGMHLAITVHPTDVSFYRVEITELAGPASNITGIYTNWNLCKSPETWFLN